MPAAFKYRILIVDDDEGLLALTADLLSREGYVVETARDGFEALTALRGSLPEILISDLKMPNMSGFELLAVVRKRLPGVGVIVYSGEFSPLATPEGVLADKFLPKGPNAGFELLETVRELLAQLPLRTQQARTDTAPAWLPLSTSGYVVVTCTACLRSFSISTRHAQFGVVMKESCVHCGAEITYRIDTSIMTAAEGHQMSVAEQSQALADQSWRTIDRTKRTIAESKRRRTAREE